MLCYHGTTLENAKLILQGNTDYKPSGAWIVSDNDNAFYVYPVNKLVNEFSIEEDEDIEDYKDQFIGQALDNAVITAGLKGRDTEIIIIEIDIPDHLLQDDFSCNNMNHIASFINLDELEECKIINVYKTNFSGYYSPYVFPTLENDAFNTAYMDYDLLKIVELIQKTNYYDVWERINEKLRHGLELTTKEYVLSVAI